jgi:hypothetical protein
VITNDGDLVHLPFLYDAETIDLKVAMKQQIWLNAMHEELNSKQKNKTWDLVALPSHRRLISVK